MSKQQELEMIMIIMKKSGGNGFLSNHGTERFLKLLKETGETQQMEMAV